MIQIKKFTVSFGDSISFLSIAEAYSLGLWSGHCRAALGPDRRGRPSPRGSGENRKAEMVGRDLMRLPSLGLVWTGDAMPRTNPVPSSVPGSILQVLIWRVTPGIG